eukprot:7147562-Prorocentrum_lima.AAC.1
MAPPFSCGFGAAVTSSICAPCQRLVHSPPFHSRIPAPTVEMRAVMRAPFFPDPPRPPSVS